MWTELLQITAFSVGINILNQRIIYKDDIEFVTEFPCFLEHPVHDDDTRYFKKPMPSLNWTLQFK